MKTNELKKKTRVLLRCGWYATLEDNLKGNTRYAKVEGYVTEIGSIYSHDIVEYLDNNGTWQKVEHTDKQKNLKKLVNSIF